MNCKRCNEELMTVAEMDEYKLCHPCYCYIFDPSNKTETETGESK